MGQNSSVFRRTLPRTDPAVIVLVECIDGPAPCCLPGRSPSWPSRTYSALAGFVEPGESLEDAVVREVHEEAGVTVTDVRYRSSQPWPFPASLMLGFRARTRDKTIVLDRQELEDARWFTRDAVSVSVPVGAGAVSSHGLLHPMPTARLSMKDAGRGQSVQKSSRPRRGGQDCTPITPQLDCAPWGWTGSGCGFDRVAGVLMLELNGAEIS